MSYPIFKLTSLNTTNLNQIGQNQNTDLYGWAIVNTNAAARYVKLYWGVPGKFSGGKDFPTVGTDIPTITIECTPAGTSINSFSKGIGNQGSLFMAMTTLPADTDATAVGAGDLIASIFYG